MTTFFFFWEKSLEDRQTCIAHMNTHLDVPVGQQQVNDDVRGEQLHAVEAFLDAA